MKKIIIVFILMVFIVFLSIILVVNKNNKYEKTILKDIIANYNVKDGN